MKNSRSNNMSALYIVVGVLIILSINYIDSILAVRSKLIPLIVICFLIVILWIIKTNNDIRKKQYVTSLYIVITDIIIIGSYVVLGYISFKSYNSTKGLLCVNSVFIMAFLCGLCGMSFGKYLINDKFKKEK